MVLGAMFMILKNFNDINCVYHIKDPQLITTLIFHYVALCVITHFMILFASLILSLTSIKMFLKIFSNP